MEELPGELLSMVFGWIPTKELYPTCFVLSSTCLVAVLDESAWRARCERDLGVVALPKHQRSWLHNYRDNLLVWDSAPWVSSSSIRFPSPALVVRPLMKGVGREYVTVRSKQFFDSGVVAIELIIEQCNRYTWSVGFIDENFDVVGRRFKQPQRDVCYSWSSSPRGSQSVTGIGSQFSRKRQVRDGWQEGDILGALLDFDKREIQYFRNGKWNETLKLHPESKRLWAMANMFELGNAVRLRLKAVGGRPPEWETAPRNVVDTECSLS